MHLQGNPEPLVDFDGLSDFSEVTTNLINTFASVIRNRLSSLINGGDDYPVDGKIEDVINAILKAIPQSIYLGDDLYLDGWLYQNFAAQNEMVSMKTKIMIHNDGTDEKFTVNNSCMHEMYPAFNSDKFDTLLNINDCAVNELLFSIYHLGITLPLKSDIITTNKLGLLSSDIVDVFGEHQLCKLGITPTSLPQFSKHGSSAHYSKNNYFQLDSTNLNVTVAC